MIRSLVTYQQLKQKEKWSRKAEYRRARAAGICPACMKRNALEGDTRCYECREYQREYWRKKYGKRRFVDG